MAARVGEQLILDLDGFQGPLDLLLTLARQQKVDLLKIAILPLVEQYLAFIRERQERSLEVAADYLVMASWLAYLKSRLMLPEPEEEEPDPQLMAEQLARRLKWLALLQDVAKELQRRPELGSERFASALPSPFSTVRRTQWQATLPALLRAYGLRMGRTAIKALDPAGNRPTVTIQDAFVALGRLLPGPDWHQLTHFLPDVDERDRKQHRAAFAATIVAALELARQEKLTLRQDVPFGPIEIRCDHE